MLSSINWANSYIIAIRLISSLKNAGRTLLPETLQNWNETIIFAGAITV